jgi:predicted DNA-binding transcriptional regulator YafY
LEVLDEVFDRDPDFDLPAYWDAWSRRFAERLHPVHADVLLTERARWIVRRLFGVYVGDTVEDSAGEPMPDGRVRARFPIENVEVAALDLLRLGPEVEVLGPPELRDAVAATARATAARYA